MKASIAIVLSLLPFVVGTANAAGDGSVLVQTAQVKQGAIPKIVTLYGSAVAGLDANRSVSVQAQGSVSRFIARPGEHVEAGALLLDFQRSESAISAFEQAQTAVRTASAELGRVKHLLSIQMATNDQVSVAEKTFNDARSTLAALSAVGDGKSNFPIKAPFSGIVLTVPVAQGDQLAAGATLMTIVRDDGLIVTAGTEPAMIALFAVGQPVKLIPLMGGANSIGRLIRMDRAINPKSRLIDIDFDSASPLVLGASYRADVTVDQLKGWIIPRAGVQLDPNGRHVFQIVGNTARLVTVNVLGEDADSFVVDGPLKADLPVVLAGSYQLKDGAAVRIEKTGDHQP